MRSPGKTNLLLNFLALFLADGFVIYFIVSQLSSAHYIPNLTCVVVFWPLYDNCPLNRAERHHNNSIGYTALSGGTRFSQDKPRPSFV